MAEPRSINGWQSALIAFTAFAECAMLVYLTLGTWLTTAWFIDDAMAAGMTDRDWYGLAAQRLGGVCVLAATAGAVVYAVNRLVARVTGHRESRVPRYSALLFAGVVFLAGLIAAIRFAIDKPFL